MDNDEIRKRATRLMTAYMRAEPPKTKTDEQFIEDITELAINVLVNLNTIANKKPG